LRSLGKKCDYCFKVTTAGDGVSHTGGSRQAAQKFGNLQFNLEQDFVQGQKLLNQLQVTFDRRQPSGQGRWTVYW
jgi:hypothetical protein